MAGGGAGPVSMAVHLEQEGAAWRIADLEHPRDAVRRLGKLQRMNGRSWSTEAARRPAVQGHAPASIVRPSVQPRRPPLACRLVPP